MQINCKNVVDLSSIKDEELNATKIFFYLDTNIWYWLTYPNSRSENLSDEYASFISRLHQLENAKLLYSHLTFSEIPTIIERDKLNEYNQTHRSLSKKKFRQLKEERSKVVNDISISLNQITRIGEAKEDFVEILNYVEKEDFINFLRSTVLDGTDALMASFLQQNEIDNIVTNDKDYLSLKDVNIFTFDKEVIKEANSKGYNTNFHNCLRKL